MPGRKRNIVRQLAVYSVLFCEPGLTVNEVAKRLELPYHTVNSAITSMESSGFLLVEDDNGRLATDRIVRV